jgi:hypothetical protein
MQPGQDIRAVRSAIWGQRFSFPSQVPVFEHLQRADIQWRVAALYFVRRWSSNRIAGRYGITRKRVIQILRQWTSLAMASGYVDRIPPLSECAF